tara:strand:- start:1037 stop:1153 length:117 start_codon:yes stop_codon:yes gene_type:complete
VLTPVEMSGSVQTPAGEAALEIFHGKFEVVTRALNNIK